MLAWNISLEYSSHFGTLPTCFGQTTSNTCKCASANHIGRVWNALGQNEAVLKFRHLVASEVALAVHTLAKALRMLLPKEQVQLLHF